MAGTVEGGKKAAATNKLKHGPNFYDNIGRKGGKVSRGGGFTGNPDLARVMGAKGGRATRMKPVVKVAVTEPSTPSPSWLQQFKNWIVKKGA